MKYSVSVVHYNMVETVEKSLRSVLDQVDDRFEVVVVDEGSTDGSLEKLKEINREQNKLRLYVSEKDGRPLGITRNMAVDRADGEYIITLVDMDDYWRPVLPDFADIFRQIEDQVDFNFCLMGDGPIMIRKDFLMADLGGFRELPVGAEDLDLFRRLLARDAIIQLKGKQYRELGYERKTWWDGFKRVLKVRYGELKSGVNFWSYFGWAANKNKLLAPFYLLPVLIARLRLFLEGERMTVPESFEQKGILEELASIEKRKSLSEIEEQYGVSIEKNRLSEKGREIFGGKE